MTDPRDLIQRMAEGATDYKEPWDITTEDGALCFASAIYSRLVGGEQDESALRWLAEYLRVNSTALSQPEPDGPTLEPRGCPTPGACSCPTSPTVPPELIRALELAEAALADIGDAEREFGDDLAWAEARAAQDLPRIRIALDRWGRPAIEPVPPSLKEQAWKLLETYGTSGVKLTADQCNTIRAVLAQSKSDGPATPSPTLMEIVALAEEIEEEGLGEIGLVRRALARWGNVKEPNGQA